MAMNPMQRKANNYLLMGVFGTLVVTGAVIAFLFMKLNGLQQENKKKEAAMKKVYVASEDIKSGVTVTADKLTQVSVPQTATPENVLSVADLTEKTIAKIDLKQGTIISQNMVQESDQKTTADLRVQEYNMIILPSQISNGDYIDIRLRLSNGVDYIVASKKQVTIPEVDGVPSEYSIKINMNETETMVMANAIVEAYIDKGSLLYATTYVEPGLQTSAIATYVPSGIVQAELNANPNIEQEAKNALFARYNQNASTRINVIDGALSQYAQDRVDNIEAGVQEEITKAKQAREDYLESLGGY